MAKEFSIKRDCTEAELERMQGEGWDIQYMQFMTDAKLHVVFVREAKPAAPTQPFVGTVLMKVPAKHMAATIDDPVIELVKARAGSRYNRVMAEGQAMIAQASKRFYEGRTA